MPEPKPETKTKSKTPHYKTDSTLDNQQSEVVELEPVVKYVVDCWEEWDSYWADTLNKFEDFYKRWKHKPPKRDEEWQAQFQKKLTWQAVAALVPRFFSILFPVSAPIEAEATETQDEGYRILAKSIVTHWFKLGKIIKEFLAGMRSAAIYGTGLFEDGWLVKTGTITEKVEKQIPDFRAMVDEKGNKILDGAGNIRSEQVGTKTIITEEKKKKIIEDRYNLKKTSIFSWRIHPYKKSDDDNYPVIKQEFITYNDLLDMERQAEKYGINKFENMQEIKEDKFKANEKDKTRIQNDGNFKDTKNPQIELLIYWGYYSDDEKEEKKPMWIGIANRKYRLWKRENPYWHQKPPLLHIVWTEDEKESYYGIGLSEIGADAEDRANNNVNIRIDERKKNIRQGGWYNVNDKKIKKSDLQKNIPGLWRGCSDVNASAKPDMPIPKSTGDDYKEEEVSVNDHREITGATPSLLPTADVRQQHSTLGGIELLQGQGLQRLKPDLSMMEIMGIRQIANRAFLLTRQFMDLPQTVELVASDDKLKQLNLQKIYTMQPYQLMGGVNFFCTGLSESIDKIQNIDKAIKFMEVLQKTSPGNPFIMYLTKRIALWLGFEDAESFMNNIPTGTVPPQGTGIQQPQMPQGLPPQLIQMIQQKMMAEGVNQGGMI